MSDLFLLTEVQMRQIEPYFPLSHGVARVDDRRVISGIVFVIRNGLPWRDAPREYGPHETIYNRFVLWSRLGRAPRSMGVIAVLALERAGHTASLAKTKWTWFIADAKAAPSNLFASKRRFCCRRGLRSPPTPRPGQPKTLAGLEIRKHPDGAEIAGPRVEGALPLLSSPWLHLCRQALMLRSLI